jgi:phosphoglycerol transferase MdoB-like AlkP superfamily enzyme
MARFIPVVLIALVALGLWIGDVEPAWWITGLVALALGVVIAAKNSVRISGRSVRFAPYIPALILAIVALGLLIADAEPAWWITALVAVGIGSIVFMSSR